MLWVFFVHNATQLAITQLTRHFNITAVCPEEPHSWPLNIGTCGNAQHTICPRRGESERGHSISRIESNEGRMCPLHVWNDPFHEVVSKEKQGKGRCSVGGQDTLVCVGGSRLRVRRKTQIWLFAYKYKMIHSLLQVEGLIDVGYLRNIALLLRAQRSSRHKNCRIGGLMFDN